MHKNEILLGRCKSSDSKRAIVALLRDGHVWMRADDGAEFSVGAARSADEGLQIVSGTFNKPVPGPTLIEWEYFEPTEELDYAIWANLEE